MSEQPARIEEKIIEQKTTFISIRAKLFIAFTVLFTIVFAVVFYWFYVYAEGFAVEQLQASMKNAINGAAEGVDVEELLALAAEGEVNAEGFSDDPRFESQLDWLDVVRSIEPRAWPYLYIKGVGTNEIIALVDLNARYIPSRSYGFKEVDESTGSLIKGLNEFTYRIKDGKFAPYTDDWGEWVSVYRPLQNGAGENVAAIGLDFEAKTIYEIRNEIRRRIIIILAVSYPVLFVLVFWLSGTLSKPIMRLTKMADHIGEGDYDVDLESLVKGKLRDEIGKLSEVFAIMVSKVDRREQRLRSAAGPAIIEINQQKTQEQVEQITGTPFFKELQSMSKRSQKQKKNE
jgi:methyl-accepting chemotaxis protein